MERKLSIKRIIFSYLIFIIGWIAWVCLKAPIQGNEYVLWAIGVLVYVLWWPLFAIFFVKRYDADVSVSFKEMISTPPPCKMLAALIAFGIVYNTGVYFVTSDGFHMDMKIYDFVVTVITVGFFEEMLFRGWFLNAISHFTSTRMANIISSLLFVSAHYPSWIYHHYDISTIILTSISIFLLSLLFGWSFLKSRSIWTNAIFHSIWDLMSFLI